MNLKELMVTASQRLLTLVEAAVEEAAKALMVATADQVLSLSAFRTLLMV